MRKEYFDVDRIVTISLFGETDAGYEWVEPQPIKRFFGLIDTGRFTIAGYVSTRYDSSIYTEEELRGYGYKVYSRNERIVNNVVDKPYVKVDLEHDNSLTIKFENEDEMLNWVNDIKILSKKLFMLVNYN